MSVSDLPKASDSGPRRWTARDTISWIWTPHQWHTAIAWLEIKTDTRDVKRVEVECSCGKLISCKATEQQMRQIRDGFRNVIKVIG